MQKLILHKFDIARTDADPLDEAELLKVLADRIGWMIEYDMDNLLSLLYRLDVLEHKINHALSPFDPDPANVALAKLVIERQKERLTTKARYSADQEKDFGDLNW